MSTKKSLWERAAIASKDSRTLLEKLKAEKLRLKHDPKANFVRSRNIESLANNFHMARQWGESDDQLLKRIRSHPSFLLWDGESDLPGLELEDEFMDELKKL